MYPYKESGESLESSLCFSISNLTNQEYLQVNDCIAE